MQMAVTSRLDESFQPVPTPGGGDWLRNHEEKGQTMKSFERTVTKAVPHATWVIFHYFFLPLKVYFT
jgi:hypothetical protein